MNEQCVMCGGDITPERPAFARLAISTEPLPAVEVRGELFLLRADWPPICATCIERVAGTDLRLRVQGLERDHRRARQGASA